MDYTCLIPNTSTVKQRRHYVGGQPRLQAIVILRKWLKCLKWFTMGNNDVGMIFFLENNQWDTDSYLVLCSIYKESADPLCSARVHVWDFAVFSTPRKRLDLSVQIKY